MQNKHTGWQRMLLIIIPYFMIVGIFQYIGAIIAGFNIDEFNYDKTSFQKVIVSLFSCMGTLLVIALFMQYLDKEKFIKLGFQIKNKLKDIKLGLLVGFAIMSFGFLILMFSGQITFIRVNFDLKEILLSILLFTFVAITEETLLRGYILRNLMTSFNKYLALLVSSVVFSLMHAFNPNIDLFALVNIFLAGILLGLSYIHTKNLWFPISLHLSWNLFQSWYGFKVSGLTMYSLVEFTLNDKNRINGGDFGFEGSVLAVVFQFIAILGIEIYFRKRNVPTTVAIV
ncbi:CPBP family intramembrane glutamic endopeptidase [Flavobacterium sp. PL002]|uniref:CPBP family intramembrane glutamic endopeptidase n=1 Tax=Flavobacterium sp. PL002 TaxID=1897058 RepID=UPI0017889FAF|nr:type II CAAX endopeptidase family protein [Flavobacterium sp. PL002]MBE0392214.1 hypothetical protein [Flavobacterium sp. PL002]